MSEALLPFYLDIPLVLRDEPGDVYGAAHEVGLHHPRLPAQEDLQQSVNVCTQLGLFQRKRNNGKETLTD